jgi:hypothetical protein
MICWYENRLLVIVVVDIHVVRLTVDPLLEHLRACGQLGVLDRTHYRGQDVDQLLVHLHLGPRAVEHAQDPGHDVLHDRERVLLHGRQSLHLHLPGPHHGLVLLLARDHDRHVVPLDVRNHVLERGPFHLLDDLLLHDVAPLHAQALVLALHLDENRVRVPVDEVVPARARHRDHHPEVEPGREGDDLRARLRGDVHVLAAEHSEGAGREHLAAPGRDLVPALLALLPYGDERLQDPAQQRRLARDHAQVPGRAPHHDHAREPLAYSRLYRKSGRVVANGNRTQPQKRSGASAGAYNILLEHREQSACVETIKIV